MLKFEFDNLFSSAVGKDDGITESDLNSLGKLIPEAHETFLNWRKTKDALFYDLVFEPQDFADIKNPADEVAHQFDNLVVLGIGGSALGLKCLAQALLPPFWNLKDKKERCKRPRLFVCDNIDPESFSGLLEMLNIKETFFVVISKSGKTTETAAQFSLVMEKLSVLGKKWKDHLAIITDPSEGNLRPLANSEQLMSFPIPPKLGGRFSVLSAVGLFPAAVLGIDIEGLIKGAKQTAFDSTSADLKNNPAYSIGAYHYLFDKNKTKSISVMMTYSDALSLVSDWYVQLWAESLGKNGFGQTPVKALGATDQHSQVQLYMEGPKNKVFTFIGVESFRSLPDSSRVRGAKDGFEYLNGHDLGHILNAERLATASALTKAGRPNMTITLPRIDAYHMGSLIMTYEIATAFAGAIYKINPFNQPGVETGKKITREILMKV